MLIAILQFAPEIGEIASNVKRAERLLQEAEDEGRLDGIDILVLPEMAFTGIYSQNIGKPICSAFHSDHLG